MTDTYDHLRKLAECADHNNGAFYEEITPAIVLALLADLDALTDQKNPRCQRSMWYEDGHESCTGSDMTGCGCPCHFYYLSGLLQKATDTARKADARYEALAARWREDIIPLQRVIPHSAESDLEYQAQTIAATKYACAIELEAALQGAG